MSVVGNAWYEVWSANKEILCIHHFPSFYFLFHTPETRQPNDSSCSPQMALQKPRMEFEDDIGETSTFDPMIHRDWAPHSTAPIGRACRIVFPAIRTQEGRPDLKAKIGVVISPS